MADCNLPVVEEEFKAALPTGDFNKQDDGSSEISDDDDDLSGSAIRFLKAQMESGTSPETLLKNLLGPTVQIPEDADEVSLWEAVLELMFRPTPRDPLPNVTTFDDVVSLIQKSNKIIVLTGAGISVSCGIPDFRSANGLYARLAVEFPELVEPQAMFDIRYFEIDPTPFFRFAKEIFPGKYTPSPCHRFISTLEKKGKLLRNYTQNIDTLERQAGITRAIYCHGSFSTATCRVCKHQVNIEDLKDTIMKEEVPHCTECTKLQNKKQQRVSKADINDDEEVSVGVMKPDIVFFGEGLPDTFHRQLEKDKNEADLLIVIGSSLKVRPVSMIPDNLPHSIPRILINKENLQYIKGFDVRLLGYGDTVITELCNRLGEDWTESVGGAKSSEGVWSPEERIYIFEGGVWCSNATPTTSCNENEDRNNNNISNEETPPINDDFDCSELTPSNEGDCKVASPLKRGPPPPDDPNSPLPSLLPHSKLQKQQESSPIDIVSLSTCDNNVN